MNNFLLRSNLNIAYKKKHITIKIEILKKKENL